MTYYPVSTPYNIFYDTDGSPLERGYIYIGEANQNPITNPITVTWDSAGLYPAAQPIRTIGGYPDRNGNPGIVYVNAGAFEDYSINVRDRHWRLVYSAMSARSMFDFIGGNNVDTINDLRSINGYDQPIYVRGHTTIGDGGQGKFEWIDGAAPGTYSDDDGISIVPTGGNGSAAWVRQYDKEYIFAAWFHDGAIDITASVISAISALPDVTPASGGNLQGISGGGTVILPQGDWETSSTITIESGITITGDTFSGTSIEYTGTGDCFRFYVSGAGNRPWYSQLKNISIYGPGIATSTNGIAFYNSQFCRVERCRIENFTNGIYFLGNDGAGTLGVYNNLIFDSDINYCDIGIDMSHDSSINENFVQKNRIRQCETNWMNIGDEINGYYVSSTKITDNNFVDVTGNGSIGIKVYGRANMIENNRMENSANYTGTQTYIQFPDQAYGNTLIANDLVLGFIDVSIDDHINNDNIIIDRNYNPFVLSRRLGPVDYYFGSINSFAKRIGLRISTNDATRAWRWYNFTDDEDIAQLSTAGIFQGNGFSGGNSALNASGGITINLNLGMTHTRTLIGNVSGITISNEKTGQILIIEWIQDGTGGWTIAGWPANVKLVGGVFTPTATAGARDCQIFFYNGTNWVEISREVNIS